MPADKWLLPYERGWIRTAVRNKWSWRTLTQWAITRGTERADDNPLLEANVEAAYLLGVMERYRRMCKRQKARTR
jgi:hypothetical protein